MGRRTWRQMADRLAERMQHHAWCPQHEDNTDGCPFCDDRASWEEYQAMGGTVREQTFQGTPVSVGELLYPPVDSAARDLVREPADTAGTGSYPSPAAPGDKS